MSITSPPYYNLRDYGCENQIGIESNSVDYINNLIMCFKEIHRITKDTGSCWVNIDDTYKNGSLLCIPDRFKIAMIDIGWICRNEIIWYKPNAMPCSCKNRFNNDYEKLFFFTKQPSNYYFKTQYESLKSGKVTINYENTNSKYDSLEQESSVRQGMNKSRGSKLVYLRKNLPEQQEFVEFMRKYSDINKLLECVSISKSKMEHWYRKDSSGFSYPTVDDWNKIKPHIFCDDEELFKKIDFCLTDITVETDDILKNIQNGRIKRTVWEIPTKPNKYAHFATFPESLLEVPIDSCCPPNGIVLDCFMGSGTTGVVSKKYDKNFIGIELNPQYCKIAEQRINNYNYVEEKHNCEENEQLRFDI